MHVLREGTRAATPLLRLRELFRPGEAGHGRDAQLSRFDLNVELERVLLRLGYATDNVRIEKDLAELPTIIGRRQEIEQVLHVLVQDALDAMPQGGVLRLRTWAQPDRVVAEVADDGPPLQVPAETFEAACREHAGPGRVPGDRLLAAWCALTARHGGLMTLRTADGWNLQRVELAREPGQHLEPVERSGRTAARPAAPGSLAADLAVPVSDADHVLGPAEAPVTVVEYGDYECPHCAQSLPILEELQDALGERMRFVFRHFPLSSVHPHAAAAATAAEAAASQGRFWQMHRQLLKHQAELDVADLQRHALKLGLEPYRFNSELSSGVHEQRIRQDIDSGKASGVKGTPTFFVNGRRIDGDAVALLAAVTDAATDTATDATTTGA